MFRLGLPAFALGVGACSFSGGQLSPINSNKSDGQPADASPNDATLDAANPDARPTERTKAGLVLRYDFNDITNAMFNASSSPQPTIADRGAAPLAPLSISYADNATVTFQNGALSNTAAVVLREPQNATTGANKLRSQCSASNEFTIEAWVQQSTDNFAPGRIFTLGSPTNSQINSVTLGTVAGGEVFFAVRTTDTVGQFGTTVEIAGAVSTSRRQFMVGRLRSGAIDLRVFTESQPPQLPLVAMNAVTGTVSWPAAHLLALFNAAEPEIEWIGKMWSVSVFGRALTDAEIASDFALGPEAP